MAGTDCAAPTLHLCRDGDADRHLWCVQHSQHAQLALESSHDVFIVPATALLSSKEGTRLAVVGPEGKVKLVEVVIERDRGAEVRSRVVSRATKI